MIKSSFLVCFRTALRVCYAPFGMLKPKNKVVFLSRQVDSPSMDFTMLAEEIKRVSPETEIKILCKTIGKGFFAKALYFCHMLRQMYHLATSEAAVLDGYCITACVLEHRNGIKIYQLWHALGLLKNFAYTALGNSEGTTVKTAEIMRMHRGYHRIICSSEALVEKIAACYDAEPKTLLPIGLPRIDFLLSEEMTADVRTKIFSAYPQLKNGRKNILYAPTLRKNGDASADGLIGETDFSEYNLIIKKHNGSETVVTDKGSFSAGEVFTGLEWISAADFTVTDYSAIIFEAMTAGKHVILYCFDRDRYSTARGFATDYAAIPAPHCTTAKQVMTAIKEYEPKINEAESFLRLHVSARKFCSAKALAYLITEEMCGKSISFEDIANNEALKRHNYKSVGNECEIC